MSKGVVAIEVTRGPLVESRHEGIAAVVKPDGTVVASWGDIDAPILPRSANKPIQAMAFVESGAVERFGLGNEHIALACASHSGEKRHVETVRAWLSTKSGWARTISMWHQRRACGNDRERWRAKGKRRPLPSATAQASTAASATAVRYGELTRGYQVRPPVQRRL
jgi:hypothetical protein